MTYACEYCGTKYNGHPEHNCRNCGAVEFERVKEERFENGYVEQLQLLAQCGLAIPRGVYHGIFQVEEGSIEKLAKAQAHTEHYYGNLRKMEQETETGFFEGLLNGVRSVF